MIPKRDAGSRTRAAVLLAAALAVMVTAGARPLGVPETAYSRSTGAPPMFLEHLTLAFLYPSYTALLPAHVFGSAARYEEELALSAVIKGGRHRFFVLSQPWKEGSLGTSRGFPRERAPTLQVGWSANAGGARLGAAVRGTSLRTAESDDSRRPSSAYLRESDEHIRYIELGGGLGAGSGENSAELVLAHRLVKSDAADVSFDSGVYSDSLVFGLESKDVRQWSVALRVRIGIGRRSCLTAAGAWHGLQQKWSAYIYTDEWIQEMEVDPYGDLWQAGVLLKTAVRHADSVAVGVDYESLRSPWASLDTRMVALRFDQVRTARLHLTLWRPLYGDVNMQAGLRKSYSWDESNSRRVTVSGNDLRFERRSNKLEILSDRFSWGLAMKWRRLDVRGAVSTTLDLDDFFWAVDVMFAL
ncbi:MAG: hypothetical protein GF355_01785 [Candidatus Eisenbacteria bacterium]|nr:hypothetical protein [Candidatus Eisenbacteria bacterium]